MRRGTSAEPAAMSPPPTPKALESLARIPHGRRKLEFCLRGRFGNVVQSSRRHPKTEAEQLACKYFSLQFLFNDRFHILARLFKSFPCALFLVGPWFELRSSSGWVAFFRADLLLIIQDSSSFGFIEIL